MMRETNQAAHTNPPAEKSTSRATSVTPAQGQGCCCRKGGQGGDKGRCRGCRFVVGGLVVLLLLGVGAELFARFYLGLGDPPLSMTDEKIEYLFQPNQAGKRFGNRYRYNAWSMRSDDFPARKSDSRELRVMVLGDSVVNGGAHTDQADIATEVMKIQLQGMLRRPVVVGNISAGSWGPPNMLAYVEKFGLFDADVVVLVLSSHDIYDAPTFDPLVGVSPSFPDRKPWLAITELLSRYGAAVRWWFTGELPEQQSPLGVAVEQARSICLAAIRGIVEMARANEAVVLVAQHFEVREFLGTPEPGHGDILRLCREMNVPVIPLYEFFRKASKQGPPLYRDQWVHPSAAGSRLMGEVLAQEIAERVGG